METIPISVEGFELVKIELEELKAERPAIIQAIKEAREEGDLSENAGYDAARERQGMLEAKISYIESRMPKFTVVDLNQSGGDVVRYGATVELVDLDTDEQRKYTLVGPDETDFAKESSRYISVFSPVGRALIGKTAGEEVAVDAPRGRISYEILSVNFEGPFLTVS